MDLEKLKAAALAATPGPWEDGGHTVYQEGGDKICKMMSLEDSAFVAAFNPAVALELIAEIERLRDVIRIVREYPDFDGQNVLSEMMDGALTGKVPRLLGAIDSLARGEFPTYSDAERGAS